MFLYQRVQIVFWVVLLSQIVNVQILPPILQIILCCYV